MEAAVALSSQLGSTAAWGAASGACRVVLWPDAMLFTCTLLLPTHLSRMLYERGPMLACTLPSSSTSGARRSNTSTRQPCHAQGGMAETH